MGNAAEIKAPTNMKMVSVFTQMVPNIISMKSIKKIKINENLEVDKTGKKVGNIYLNRLSESFDKRTKIIFHKI